MPADEQQIASPASKAFASSLAKYAYAASSSSSPNRRLPKRSATEDPSEPPRKQRNRAIKSPALASPSKKPAKKSRGYAGPEVYGHLKPVNDLLSEGLDLVFCGINPGMRIRASINALPDYSQYSGKQSATLGHHFAHPTNKFWRALYQSGLTSRLVPPTEDHLIIDEFNFGLTNLVDRPTSEQSELSTLEMRLNTAQLLSKFVKYHPGVVCFVGKRIWDVFESVVKKTVFYGEEVETMVKAEIGTMEEGTERKVSILTPQKKSKSRLKDGDYDSLSEPLTAMPSIAVTPIKRRLETPSSPASPRGKKSKSTKTPFSFSTLQSIRLPHAYSPGGQRRFTYFFVVPSTSGLERTPLPDQVSNFTALKDAMEVVKQGREPAGHYLDIDVLGVEQTVEDMRRGSLQKATLS
ncbi:hypothetical protein IAR50_004035 [Cryptococcus sp. DSM 104548]